MMKDVRKRNDRVSINIYKYCNDFFFLNFIPHNPHATRPEYVTDE